MKKLGLMDDAFLRLESRKTQLHIGVLMLFEPPASAGEEFVVQLAERLRQSTKAAPPFNYRLVKRRGSHYWEEDAEFDLDHHFVHTSLPQPGRIRELLALVSRVHCGHLDRDYPLWRMYLIEGLEDGRFAMYLKIHHAMVDGVAGIRLLVNSMAASASASKKLPPPWEVETKKSNAQPLPVPSPAADSLPALRKLASEGIRSLEPVVKEVRKTFSDVRSDRSSFTVAGDAPKTLFNKDVSATRRFAAQSYATPRIRAVAEAYGASTNDVVLAMCGSALRRYLADHGEHPKKSLTAAVPVSVRRPGSDGGNEIAFCMTTLATHVDDPGERLRAIKAGMDYNKDLFNRLSPGQVMGYAATMTLLSQAGSMLGWNREQSNAMATVCISHVPGPRQDMYWQGAKMVGMYPISLLIDGGTLNITLISRHDYVDFGLIACRKSVPSMQRLLEYLEDGLAELEATIEPPRKSRPRRAGRKSAVKRGAGSSGRKSAAARKKPVSSKPKAKSAAKAKSGAKGGTRPAARPKRAASAREKN